MSIKNLGTGGTKSGAEHPEVVRPGRECCSNYGPKAWVSEMNLHESSATLITPQLVPMNVERMINDRPLPAIAVERK